MMIYYNEIIFIKKGEIYMFTTYKNNDGDSGVESYEIGDDYIAVKFYNTAKIYIYSYRKAGINHVERMKELAASGDGLNSYINTFCRYLYD